LDIKNLFGINGVNADKKSFQSWIKPQLNNVFPFCNNLKVNTEIAYTDIEELKKYEDSKILIVGGGPSTNEVNWQNLDYDYIWSLNHFYLNEKLNDKKVDLACIGGEVDLQNDIFIDYVSEYNPLLMFEWHGRWVNERDYFEKLSKSYPKLGCFHTRAYGKLGGAIRMMILALYLKVKEVYIVGQDGCPGLSVTKKKFINYKHSFEKDKKSLPWKINEDNAYEIFYHQYKTLWNYILNDLDFNTKIFNLGENCEFNFTSIWSKKHFPLTENMKKQINNHRRK
tara:strand:- start:81 stop:926 length:846 start_codon:yes stop_codon:yes gene_type:complete